MYPLAKAALFVEVLACFSTTIFFFIVGLPFLPHQIHLLRSIGSESAGPMIMYYVSALLGAIGVITLMREIWLPGATVVPSWLTMGCIVAGVLALLSGPLGMFILAGFGEVPVWYFLVLAVLPLLCLAHLCYLGRRYLFRTKRPSS